MCSSQSPNVSSSASLPPAVPSPRGVERGLIGAIRNLQARGQKLALREVKKLIQHHIASEWQRQQLNPGPGAWASSTGPLSYPHSWHWKAACVQIQHTASRGQLHCPRSHSSHLVLPQPCRCIQRLSGCKRSKATPGSWCGPIERKRPPRSGGTATSCPRTSRRFLACDSLLGRRALAPAASQRPHVPWLMDCDPQL